jgi:hypothetical protein
MPEPYWYDSDMDMKRWVWGGFFLGSTVGSFLPALWGDSGLFSFSSIVVSSLGGAAGIWAGFMLAKYFGG